MNSYTGYIKIENNLRMDLIKSILLIDDNRFLNLLNINMIRNLAIAKDVHVVQDGFEALDYLESCKDENKQLPEVIFLDLFMPELDGLGFLKYFNKYIQGGKCKVIVLSSLVKDEIIPELKKLGVEDIIFKPLTEQVLIERISKYFPGRNFNQHKKPLVDF